MGRGPSADPALGGAGASGDGLRVESTCKDESGVYGILGRNAANDNTGVLGAPGAGVEGRQGRSGLWGALGSASAGARATGTTVVLALVVDGTAAFKRCGLAPVPAGKCSVRSSGHTFGPLPEHGFAMLQAYRGGVAVAATVIDSKAGTITIYPTKKVTTATPVTWYPFAPIAYSPV